LINQSVMPIYHIIRVLIVDKMLLDTEYTKKTRRSQSFKSLTIRTLCTLCLLCALCVLENVH